MVDPWRQRILDAAQSWLRTPWAHNQACKGAGVDCGRLLLECYVEADCADPAAIGDYPSDWMLHRDEERFLEWVERYCDRVERPEPADVAVWRFGRCFSHGAIVFDWPRVIHAYAPERAVVWGDADRGRLAMRKEQGAAVPREVRFYSRAARLAA